MAPRYSQPWPGLSLLLLAAALAATLAVAAASGDNLAFCRQYLATNKRRCPAVQPLGSLDVGRLKGRWYEVAASSYHQFTAELGATCTAFEFSAAPKQNGSNAMRVTRSTVEAVGPIRATQVAAIASASRRSARNLRGVCAAIAAQKLPSDVLSEPSYASLIAEAQTGLPAASLDGKAAGQTSNGLSAISAALGHISAQAAAINARLARIQPDLAPANQVDRVPKLEEVRNRVGNLTAEIRRSVRAIQRTRGGILKQAEQMRLAVMSGVKGASAGKEKQNRLKLLNATLALQRQASNFGTLAVSATKISLLSSLAAPAAASLFESPINLTQSINVRGTLLQARQGGGNVVLKFGANPAVRYLVVYASPGFDLVALYACSAANRAKLAATEGQAKVMVLSRQQSVSADALTTVQTALQQKGVVLGGANVLVTTEQNCS